MSASKKNAICGLCAALSVTVLLLLNLLSPVSYCLAMTACIPIIFCFIEIGKSRAVMVYIAAALISHMVVPNLGDILLFSAIYGVITLLKIPTDTINNKFLRCFVKGLIYLTCDGIYYFLTLIVFDLPIFEEFSLLILIGSMALGLFLGFIYDKLLSFAIYIYFERYRKYILKFLK